MVRLKTEVEILRCEKEFEERRVIVVRHEQEFRAVVIIREEEKRAAMQKGARMTTEELLNEAEFRESYSSRTFAAMKKNEDVRNGPYEYDLDAAIEQYNVNGLIEIRGWAKSSHFKGTRQNFTLDIIFIEQWEQRVESITTAEWQKRPNHILDVEFICTDCVGLRRGIQVVNGSAQSFSHRRMRISNFEDQYAVVRDRQETLGDHLEQLITR